MCRIIWQMSIFVQRSPIHFASFFFPLALLGFHDLIERRPRLRALALAGAALAGLIFSHYALALLFIALLSASISF